jgi:hypothetical protein
MVTEFPPRIGNADLSSESPPVRQLLCAVMLLALRDNAAEVKFVPSREDKLWSIWVRVGKLWEAMVPFPIGVQVSLEIRHLAGIELDRRYVPTLLRDLATIVGRQANRTGCLQFQIGNEIINLGLTLGRPKAPHYRDQETVRIHLPPEHQYADIARLCLVNQFNWAATPPIC